MRKLQNVIPTPEQLKLITQLRPGIRIIRGAAGSGKTTTSLLMLKTALGVLLDVFRENSNSPAINVKVFTFNKTLAAYVGELVTSETKAMRYTSGEINLDVCTVSKYLCSQKPIGKSILENNQVEDIIISLGEGIQLTSKFLVDEVEYLLGRLSPANYEDYIEIERAGRGTQPRVDKNLRRKILDEVIYPYIKLKDERDLLDWNDLSLIAGSKKFDSIDLIVIDEAQDFSANQLKAILNQLSPESFTTIVLDSAQRIYRRSFTWKDIGIKDARFFRLERNYRNSYEIANFALKLLQATSVQLEDDATLPDIQNILRRGDKPEVVQGTFSQQITHIIRYIQAHVNLQKQTVGFLHPKGGGWFKHVKECLDQKGLAYVDIARKDQWPEGHENIALSTIHSAKGLEFDYVFIVGLEDRHFTIGENTQEDCSYTSAIKLLAMAITRAKENVILSYKKDTKPQFISHLDQGTFTHYDY